MDKYRVFISTDELPSEIGGAYNPPIRFRFDIGIVEITTSDGQGGMLVVVDIDGERNIGAALLHPDFGYNYREGVKKALDRLPFSETTKKLLWHKLRVELTKERREAIRMLCIHLQNSLDNEKE